MKMKKKLKQELEKPENWDFDQAKTKEPITTPRAVVSVAFRNNDFAIISTCAERSGKKISEFIREAALDKAMGRNTGTSVQSQGSSGTIWCGNTLPSFTRVQTFEVEHQLCESAITY
jgi:hypothetical protein